MKQEKLLIDFFISKHLIFVFLAIALLLNLSSCTTEREFTPVTNAALKLAREEASLSKVEYRKIERVASTVAVKQENGDISVCVELETSSETDKHKLNTITIPIAALTGETDSIQSFGFRPGSCPIREENCFWYPIEESGKDCKIFESSDLSVTSYIPVEKLEVHGKDWYQFHITDILDSIKDSQQTAEKIYEVSMVPANITEPVRTFLIYWPEQQLDEKSVPPISIGGTYEDKSTRLYYLIVPLAWIADTLLNLAILCVYFGAIPGVTL